MLQSSDGRKSGRCWSQVNVYSCSQLGCRQSTQAMTAVPFKPMLQTPTSWSIPKYCTPLATQFTIQTSKINIWIPCRWGISGSIECVHSVVWFRLAQRDQLQWCTFWAAGGKNAFSYVIHCASSSTILEPESLNVSTMYRAGGFSTTQGLVTAQSLIRCLQFSKCTSLSTIWAGI